MAFLATMLLPFLAMAQITLSGKVTDKKTLAPLQGASVSFLSSSSVLTDANGNYRLTVLGEGNYEISASHMAYRTSVKNLALKADMVVDFALAENVTHLQEITIQATRASDDSPTAFTNVRKNDIEKNNLGQDLPFVLNLLPSVVATSNSGVGIGYTGLRIRGSDATRINVTINGIPFNNPESQGSFFVNIPDFVSSVDNIQVQRGVGTSTNGAAAFGASINMQTNTRRDSAYAGINTSAGSYGTLKNTVQAGTGLLHNKFAFDGRLSRIVSDGYTDRGSSDLKSFYLSGAYYGKNNSLKAVVFSGLERTYQSWNGVPDNIMAENNRRYNGLGYISEGNYYKDQVDNYNQTDYQLHYDQRITPALTLNAAIHYTKGKGYYQEYRDDDKLAQYGITPVVIGGTAITNSTLVRKRALDNDFYGVTYSLNYKPANGLNLILGGAYNEYDGDHIGNIIYTEQSAGIPPDYEYYRNNTRKKDFHVFTRAEYKLGDFLFYTDLQYRNVRYRIFGPANNLQFVDEKETFNFFNPKLGVTYHLNRQNQVYASFAVGNREPNRDDFTDILTGQPKPLAENLQDWEAGYRYKSTRFTGGANFYYMRYRNQLVVTGQLNDVGSQARRNVPDSYRAGIELEGLLKITDWLEWSANATVSTNKIRNYTQSLNNNDNNTLAVQHFGSTDIAFSPSLIAGSEISFILVKGGSIALINKYVGRQYLDNTSNMGVQGFQLSPAATINPYAANRYLNAYFLQDVRFNYNFSMKSVRNVGISLLVNNVFSKKYESNGATFPGISGGHLVNNNTFFPQAPRNFLVSLSLAF